MRTKDLHIKGIKEIQDLMKDLPKQINQNRVWSRIWRHATKEIVDTAKANVPNKTEQLKNSIGFFTTKASRKYLGGYVGPRVKGRFSGGGSKNYKGGDKKKKYPKSGFYGAMVEYGGSVQFGGKGYGKDQPFMKKAWNSKNKTVLLKTTKSAEIIVGRVLKSHKKRLEKFGILGV